MCPEAETTTTAAMSLSDVTGHAGIYTRVLDGVSVARTCGYDLQVDRFGYGLEHIDT